jgi:hypothetical protein
MWAPVWTRKGRAPPANGASSTSDDRARTSYLINRARLLLGWGLRLERAGRRADAEDRFGGAGDCALAVEKTWPTSRFPGREHAAADVHPTVGAVHALADPGPGQTPRRQRRPGGGG